MKLAYSTNAYAKFPLPEAIDRIAALAYRGIELMADMPHVWPATTTDSQIETIRRHLDAHELTIANVNAFMMNAVQDFWHPSWIEPDVDFRSLRIRHTIDALRLARKLGATCITTEPGGPLEGDMTRDTAIDIFVQGLNEALDQADTLGIRLLVEPEPGLLIENAEQFLELAGRITSPMFGLNFDLGHFYCAGEPLPETVERLRPYTRHYHIEDIAATRVHRHLIPGRGAIDFPAVLSTIRDTGYDGWLTVELYPYLDDPDGAGQEARDYLAGLLPP